MKILAIVSLILLLSCGAYQARSVSVSHRTPQEQLDAAVRIVTACDKPEGNGYGLTSGSGVSISPGVVLTAYHVVACDSADSAIVVRFPDGHKTEAELVRFDPSQDVARLELVDPWKPSTPIEFAHVPNAGDLICVASAIPSHERKCGNFTRINNRGQIEHTAIVEPGNSGSAMYDTRGKLVAIVTHLRTCNNGQYCGGVSTYARQWVTDKK